MILFEDATLIKNPYVEIDGQEYEVQPPEYSGGTDLNADNLNQNFLELHNILAPYIDIINTYNSPKHTLTLQNRWANYGTNFNSAFYRQVGKRVFLGGLVRSTNSTSDIITTLPSNYRPKKTVICNVWSMVNTTQSARKLVINTDGTVVFNTRGSGASDYVSLENVSFDLD